MTKLQTQLKNLYLEYINDFLTVKKFAEYHNIDIRIMTQLLKAGKAINNNN